MKHGEPRQRASWVDRAEWLGPLMIGPAVLYIVLVLGVPFLLALYYSVSDISMGSRTLNFVGLKNFASVIQTTKFQTSLWNTFVFAIVSQVLVMVLATVLALALSRDFRGKWFVRLLILLPWVAPISLGTIGWLWILDSTYSVINWTLEALGLIGPAGWYMWLGVPWLAMGSVITIHVWRILPLATVILMAGLTSIPHDINDAAQVDGAGFSRRLFQITLPLIRPIALVAGLFGLVLAFTDMIVIFVLTRGGPYDTTQVLASLAFFTGIQGGDLAEGAAIAVFLFPLLVAVAIVFLRVARRAEVH
ncbi:MAG: ABC transporter permease [Candidatus Rokubacteria bacterium RIFCSPHIGHO2_12_FULL_73_22]|nr:MAG: ABC transporter permease [Candidatus Rokubacteria bacterium RIFCSPHIGHO2_02_FULL_73_26]OGK99865.1 MAG: ABC transporter permease [Candidatus Rokubacteria bacterium RIFCSPHIGHO2_12_FULL_73_22]OGL29067.1 MAG: ABC transporter permease [Candidatus Rokubacteria bacterium RIFCSPLOWO2_12_FULL_73_47]